MAIGTRELYLVLRARDEASRILRNAGDNIRNLSREQIAAAQAQMHVGQGLATAGVSLVFAGAAAASWFKEATDAAIAYNQEAAKTLTQTDGLNTSLEELKDIGRDVARAIPAPFEEMQGALYDIFSSMDVNTKQSRTLLTAFSKAAVAGQVDLQDASRATISVLNAWRMPAERVNQVNDVMFQLVRKGVGTYAEFSKSIGRAIPSAVRAGQSFETLAGMMAFLTRNGLSTSMAATSAARALDAFSHPATVERLEKMGVAVRDAKGQFRPLTGIIQDLSNKMKDMTAPERAQALQELFKGSGGTIQARRFIDMALKNFDEFNKRVGEMKKSAGVADEAYNIMFKQPQSQMQLLSNRWEIMRTEVGDLLIPNLLKLVDAGLKLLDMWNKLSPGMKEIIVQTAVIVTAFTILVGIILTVVGVVTMLMAAAALAGVSLGAIATTAGIVVGVLAALGAAIYLVIKYHNELGNIAKQVWHGLVDAFDAVVDYLRPVINLAEDLYDVIASNVMPILRQFWEQMKQAASDALPSLIEGWRSFQSSLEDLWTAIQPLLPVLHVLVYVLGGALVVAIAAVVFGILGLIQLLSATLVPAITGVAKIIQGAMQVISGLIKFWSAVFTGDWRAAWEAIKQITSGIGNIIVGLWRATAGTINAIVQQLVHWVVAGFQWLYDVLVGHSIIPDMVNAILRWVRQLGTQFPAIIRQLVNLAIQIFFLLPAQTLARMGQWVGQMVAKAVEMMSRFASAIKSGVATAVSYVRGMANDLVSAVTSIGSRMYSAGANLMGQVAAGVRSMAGSVKDAGAGVLQGLRNMLPGSPIKDGPLLKWNKGGAGIRLMSLLAQGIKSSQQSVVNELDQIMKRLAAIGDKGAMAVAAKFSARIKADLNKRETLTKQINEATKSLNDLKKSYADFVNQTQADIMKNGGVMNFLNPDGGTTASDIISGMKASVQQANEFANAIARLKKAGLNKDSLAEIIQAGPEKGLEVANALLKGGQSAITQVNSLEGLLAKAGKNLGTVGAEAMYRAGLSAAKGLLDGLVQQRAAIIKEMAALGHAMVAAIKKELGIKSPSRRMRREVAHMAGEGLIQGLTDYIPRVRRASDNLGGAIGFSGSGMAYAGASNQQNFYITTQEIDPRKHAADLGWEMMAGTPS